MGFVPLLVSFLRLSHSSCTDAPFSDLVEALVEDLDAMAAGDGLVGVQRGSEEVFRDSIVQCVFSSSNDAALERQREADESRAEAERLERQKEVVLQKQRELELKLEAERLEAERVAEEEAEAARQVEKRRKKEEKKRRKKEADEAKARMVAEKEEEERREAEAEKRKRLDLKRQKQLAMAAHSEQTEHTTDEAAAATGASALSANEQTSGHDPDKSALATVTAPSRASSSSGADGLSSKATTRKGGNKANAAFAHLGDRLSVFIAGPPKDDAIVSPIFALLQDESTVRRGRELLQLECLAREQAGVVDRMVRQQKADRKKLEELNQKAAHEKMKWEGKKKDPKDAKKGKESKKDDKKEEGRKEKITKQIKNTEKQIGELIAQNVASTKQDVDNRDNFFKRYKWHDAQRAEAAEELASLQETAELGPAILSEVESLMREVETRSGEISAIKQRRSEASSSGFLGGLFDRDARKLKGLEAGVEDYAKVIKKLQETIGIDPASLDGLGAAWKKRSRAIAERVRALQEELPKK